MSILHPVTSWINVYRTLREVAEAQRGTVSLSSLSMEPAGWPRTTGFDALAIASVFDPAVPTVVPPELAERWFHETDLLARQPHETLGDIYTGNRSFWATLSAVAGALHQRGAALPAWPVWNAALHELTTESCSACTPTLTTRTVIAQFPHASTWEEMAQLQLQFFWVLRGVDIVDGPLLVQIPRTTNADILQLATYWSEQLVRLGPCDDAITRHAHANWTTAVEDVGRFAKGASWHATYPRNAEFWRALIALAIQAGTSAGAPALWTLYVDVDLSHGKAKEHRNTAPAPLEGPTTVEFPATATWDEAAQMQRAYFSKLRGEDVVQGGLIAHVPRTTNRDVVQLAAYWTKHLVRVGVSRDVDASSRHIVDRWRTAIADVHQLTHDADPSAVYARNTEFWTALMTIALQVAVTDEAPSRWTLIKESVEHSISILPETLSDAASWASTKVADVFTKVADVSKSVGLELAKPLLLAAGGLLGLVFLLRMARGDRNNDGARSERSGM